MSHSRHGLVALVSRSRFGRQGGHRDGRQYGNRLRNRQGFRQDGSSRHSGVPIGGTSDRGRCFDHVCSVREHLVSCRRSRKCEANWPKRSPCQEKISTSTSWHSICRRSRRHETSPRPSWRDVFHFNCSFSMQESQ